MIRNSAYKPKSKRRGPPRRSKSLIGYKAQLTRAINMSTDGAYAMLDLKTVSALVSILDRNIDEAKDRENADRD